MKHAASYKDNNNIHHEKLSAEDAKRPVGIAAFEYCIAPCVVYLCPFEVIQLGCQGRFSRFVDSAALCCFPPLRTYISLDEAKILQAVVQGTSGDPKPISQNSGKHFQRAEAPHLAFGH